jgi:hypothetical protein
VKEAQTMTFSKRLMLLVLVAALSVPVFGCGVGSTPAENGRTIARIIDYDARMLRDDLALLAQLHRPLRTSRWIID